MSLGGVVILAVLAWPGSASHPAAAPASFAVMTRAVSVSRNLTFIRTSAQSLTDDTVSNPRIDTRAQTHDPAQFAGLRALRFDRGRYRPSPLDAKLEFRMTGDSTSVGLGGAVSRLLRQVAK